MRIDRRRPRQALLPVVLLLTATIGVSPAEESIPVISSQQIEADWLRQDAVRNLPPSPRTRPEANKPVATQDDAAGACDGVKDGTFGFHTDKDEKPWWQVDLGETLPLDRVLIYNRCDGGVQTRASRIEVLVSSDAETWTRIYQHDGSEFLGQPDDKPLAVPGEKKSARFVRVQLPTTEYFHLDEVEVYRVGDTANVALHKPADQSSVSPWSKSHETMADTGAQPGEEPAEEPAYPIDEVVGRGLMLAENLRGLGVDVTSAEGALREVGDELAGLTEETPPAVRKGLYFKARWAQRNMSLANPLLDFDDLLFVKRIPGTFTHMSDQYYGWWSRPGGGLYILKDFKSDAPQLVCLTDDLPSGSVLRPDISHDGAKVLFAYCRYHPGVREEANKLDKSNVPEDAFYHLYEINLDGTGLRRLTRGKYDDFDGRYLPDGRVLFLSTRRGQYIQCSEATARGAADGQLPDCYVRCGGGPSRPVAVYTLHVMDTDGENLQQISPFEMFEWTPSVDHEGRILYSRWDYVDRWNMPFMSLWSTMPDGTNTQALFGNFTLNPHCVFEPRSIPGSQKLIFTASGHHANTGGSLVLLDTNRAVDGPEAMRRLTPEVAFPETEGWPMSYFANPLPLSEEHYLVAWSDKEMIGWPGPAEPVNAHGIYLFDSFGNLTLLHRDPAISSMTPIPIRARRRPPTISSKVAWSGAQEGRMLLVDVHEGLDSIPRGTIHRLRIVGVPAKTHPTMNFPVLGLTNDDPGKFVMGSVPVEEDGSAYFRVPSGVTFFMQALDERGRAVQTMRSAAYVQPGQTYTCVGCHEQRNTSPPNTLPMATHREPSKMTPGVEGSWPLDFKTMVQPVLDSKCVECHAPGTDGEKFDLTAEKSYDTLVDFGSPSLRQHVMDRYLAGRSVAGSCASSVSPLAKLIEAGHYEVEFSSDDWQRLFTWMDTYAHRQGSFSEEQDQRLHALRQRMAPMLAN